MSAKFGIDDADRYLTALPFFHVAGLGTIFAHLQAGGAFLPIPKWDPEKVLSLIAQFGITTTFVVPPMLTQLVDAVPIRNWFTYAAHHLGEAGFDRGSRADHEGRGTVRLARCSHYGQPPWGFPCQFPEWSAFVRR